jgi:hypothetical protein
MLSRRDKRMEPVEKALNLRRLIVNADDFGCSEEVNEAIIRAYNEGVLTSTSLMVTGSAFDHAVRPEKYVAGAPQLFDLLADPQERYDILMNSFTENTWAAPIMGEAVKKLMESYIKYPPRKLQSDGYTGPITITNFQKFQWLREQLAKDGFSLGLPGQ